MSELSKMLFKLKKSKLNQKHRFMRTWGFNSGIMERSIKSFASENGLGVEIKRNMDGRDFYKLLEQGKEVVVVYLPPFIDTGKCEIPKVEILDQAFLERDDAFNYPLS